MIISSHQPSFFPWVGYWAKLAASNVHVFSASVDFNWRSFQHRAMFAGGFRGLALAKAYRHTGIPIREVRYDVAALAETLSNFESEFCGKHTRQADDIRFLLDAARGKNSGWLYDLNHSVLLAGLELFDLHTELAYDKPTDKTTKTTRLFDRIVKSVSITEPVTYLAGAGARNYLQKEEVPAGFSVVFQTQNVHVPNGSIIEVLANGFDVPALFAQFGTASE